MRLIDADALIEFCAERWIPLNIDAVNMQPTIEPSTSCSEFPNNSDTISRQAAIDIFDDYNIAVENGELEAYSRDRKRLCNLPTIQPQSTVGQLNDSAQSTDLIDRQKAIDALNEYFARIGKLKRRGLTEGEKAISLDTVGTIKTLPPAQPEPKEGHWIRTDCGLDVECKCSRCGYKDFVEPRDEYWFKRNYCPNCGAKMRGEQHETD